MELLQTLLIATRERGRKVVIICILICLRVLQRFAGEVKAPKKPHQAFGRGSFLLRFFVYNELFEGSGLGGGCIITGADFLVVRNRLIKDITGGDREWTHGDVPCQIVFNRGESGSSKEI